MNTEETKWHPAYILLATGCSGNKFDIKYMKSVVMIVIFLHWPNGQFCKELQDLYFSMKKSKTEKIECRQTPHGKLPYLGNN